MFLLPSERVESVDGIAERAGITDMFPGQSRERGAEWSDGGVDGLYENTLAV